MKANLIKRLESLKPKHSLVIVKALDCDWVLDKPYKTPINGAPKHTGPLPW